MYELLREACVCVRFELHLDCSGSGMGRTAAMKIRRGRRVVGICASNGVLTDSAFSAGWLAGWRESFTTPRFNQKLASWPAVLPTLS